MQKFWASVFGVVLLACFLLFAGSYFYAPWWLPLNVCSFGPEVDHLFYLICGFTGFFYVLTLTVLVVGMWRFGHQAGRKATYTHGSHKLELVWTAVPSLILLFIAFAQVNAWSNIKYQSRMPKPDQVFEVTARMWEWRFRYPAADQLATMKAAWKEGGQIPDVAKSWFDNGHMDDINLANEVHTWKGAKVRFMLHSRDVIHSFFLPNMRIKQDAMPGKSISVWFDAEEANCHMDGDKVVVDADKRWELACAELCGARHSMMRGRVCVHESKDAYLKWLDTAAKATHATRP